MLVEAIMCKADETPLTMIWFDNSILPGGNRTIAHECVNWNALIDGMEKIKVDPFEPGVLVHPQIWASGTGWQVHDLGQQDRLHLRPSAFGQRRVPLKLSGKEPKAGA